APATIPIAARTLFALARRRILRALDQLLGRDDGPVLVLGEELQADPAALLVDLLDDNVEHVATTDHVLDVTDAPRAYVRHVQQPVGSLLQLDERTELRRLDDLRF